MKVLSTKILTEAANEKLRKAGITCTQLPFIAITYLHPPGLIQFLTNNANLPFVFTSQNAFKALMSYSGLNPFPAAKQAFCMEGNTELLLQQSGWQVLGTAVNSEQLARVIQRSGQKELIYVTGNLRSNTLFEKLLYSSHILNEWVMYETALTPVSVAETFDAVLFFSPSGVNSFFSLNTLPPLTKAVCIGPATAAALQACGHTNIFTPAKPGIDAVIDLAVDVLTANPNL